MHAVQSKSFCEPDVFLNNQGDIARVHQLSQDVGSTCDMVGVAAGEGKAQTGNFICINDLRQAFWKVGQIDFGRGQQIYLRAMVLGCVRLIPVIWIRLYRLACQGERLASSKDLRGGHAALPLLCNM